MAATTSIPCIAGRSADREVLLGYAPASTLYRHSFADLLDEESGRGYQRRFNTQHSLDFRRYIQRSASSTIPLTFNLRSGDTGCRVDRQPSGGAILHLPAVAEKVLAQVDCQHRLGHLSDLEISLPFMCFLGLSAREEMEIFNVINSKAKGLNASLLDYHDAQLTSDLARERPELFISLHLRNAPQSPWYRQLDLGGSSTSGLGRKASLRTMQKAIKHFLIRSRILRTLPAESAAQIVLDFWSAVTDVLPEAWAAPRKHVLTKGVGVYALMELAADFLLETPPGTATDRRFFVGALSDFALEIDWTTTGPLQGLGGEGGVKQALCAIRDVRRGPRLRVISNGR